MFLLTYAPLYCRRHSRMCVRDQITDGLSNMNSRWKLSCFSIAESVPEGQNFEPRQKNEVLGDVSFEEVRWADYQEPNKQACVQRFAQANRMKSAQFQVGLRRPHMAERNRTCAPSTQTAWPTAPAHVYAHGPCLKTRQVSLTTWAVLYATHVQIALATLLSQCQKMLSSQHNMQV